MGDSVKQNVQWFPGHMAKTRREIKETLRLADAVIIFLDARVPYSSNNPEIDSLTEGKPRIVVLNKSDLADPEITAKWAEHYRRKGAFPLEANCLTGKGLEKFRPLVAEVLADKAEAYRQKGMGGRELRLMVAGVPNTGKSSFINRLAGNKKAKVENRAGVTLQTKWFDIGGGLRLLDTPGVLWPKFDDPRVGDRLAFTGGVKDGIVDSETLAVRLLELLAERYPRKLEDRYSISVTEDRQAYELLEDIGRKRGFLMRGGEINTERAAKTLLAEFKDGLLGRISLEEP